MWKKAPKSSGSNPLSGKDAKSLKQAIKSKFTIDDAALTDLFKGSATVTKVEGAIVYFCDGQPMFWERAGVKGDVMPTVYTLWKYPSLLPVVVIHAPVSQYILKGADLMFQGLLPSAPLPLPLDVDDVVAIVASGNPLPIAVAAAKVAVADGADVSALKGKGFEVLHAHADALWGLGSKLVPPAFSAGEVFALADAAAAAAAAADELAAVSLAPPTAAPAPAAAEAPVAAAAAAAEGPELDALLEQALLTALKTRVQDSDLPMDTSLLFNTHVQPCRRHGAPPLDVKLSSHKKLSKFLAVMQKAQLLEVKEKGGTSMLTKVHRDCPKYIIHTPPADTHAQAQDDAAAAAAAGPGGSIAVRCLFRPTSEHAQLLNVPKDSYLDSSDIIAKLSEVAAAAAAAGATPFDGKNICLTATMADVVFKKMPASARRVEGDVVPVEEIARACESKMAEFYELKTASGSEIKRGSVKHIKIVVESLQGGRKHMTHVQNIDAWGIDPEVARTELQRMCASACTVQPLPGDHGKELQIQGTFDTQAVAYLTKTFGIDAKYIDKK